jgi:imidazolonepropionase
VPEAVVASTINAAFAIDRGDELGSIEEGKKADVIILDVEQPEEIPYHFGVNLVHQVIKGGKTIYRAESL